MLIQTMTPPTQTDAGDPHVDRRAIVAPEESDLAAHLRSNGWVARSGWRRSSLSGHPPTWFVRFECPDQPPIDTDA